ncbi:MAG: RNA polymerase sporulation sigma factor SigE [Clostridia bacterium]|nr:RNA polymerase sporulation sigma factor SigE [Clostridia bacterium]
MFTAVFEKIKNFVLKIYSNDNTLDYVGDSGALPEPYSAEEEQVLLKRLSDGDESVRDGLVEHNLRLVVYIARKFENTGVELDDLISIGAIGLIKAVRSFKIDKNIKLATYASRCIENEILMHLRRTSKIKAEISFDEPLSSDSEGNDLLLSDVMGTDEDAVYKKIEEQHERAMLKKVVSALPSREKSIIELRYGLTGQDELTQREVADIMGISQSYISRLEKKILSKLKKDLSKLV